MGEATIFLFLTLILKAAIEYPNETVFCQRTFTMRFAVWYDDYAWHPFFMRSIQGISPRTPGIERMLDFIAHILCCACQYSFHQ